MDVSTHATAYTNSTPQISTALPVTIVLAGRRISAPDVIIKPSVFHIRQRRRRKGGVFGAHPVRVLVISEPGRPTLARVTTDPTTPVAARYAARWAIEGAFEDAKQITGVGEARNRIRKAVERTVPFDLYTQSIVMVWYHLAGHHPNVVRDRAPWYTTKRHPSYLDMIVKLRRVLIAQYQPEVRGQRSHEEMRAVRLAWGQAAA